MLHLRFKTLEPQDAEKRRQELALALANAQKNFAPPLPPLLLTETQRTPSP